MNNLLSIALITYSTTTFIPVEKTITVDYIIDEQTRKYNKYSRFEPLIDYEINDEELKEFIYKIIEEEEIDNA